MGEYYFYKSDQDVLNYCTKYLARFNTDPRHAYGAPGTSAPRDRIAEAWRFPVIGTYGGGATAIQSEADFSDYNEVTFIYNGADGQSPTTVWVIGTFATLHHPIPLRRATFDGEPTRYFSVTYAIPQGQVHRYRLTPITGVMRMLSRVCGGAGGTITSTRSSCCRHVQTWDWDCKASGDGV